MDGLQALSHAVALVSKPLVPNLHPKSELREHIRALPPEATAYDVAFIAVLWAFTGPTGEAYPGQERIAREARMGVRTVREVSQRLERAGRIARRLPAPSIRPSRKTTRYQLAPLAPGPRAVRSIPDTTRTGEAPARENSPAPAAASSPPLQRQQPPPAEQEHRQPPPVPHRQPPPVKSPSEINQIQSARAPVVPQAEGLAAQWTAPAAQRPAAAPSPRSPAPSPVAAKRPAAAPNTAAALATLRAWVPPAKQLSLGLAESPLESTKGTADRERVIPTTTDEPSGSWELSRDGETGRREKGG